MTLAEWAALDEDVEGELVDGVLEDEEMPSVLHEAVVLWLGAILRSWARRRRGLATGVHSRPHPLPTCSACATVDAPRAEPN